MYVIMSILSSYTKGMRRVVHADSRYCSLPPVNATAGIPNVFNSSVICPTSDGANCTGSRCHFPRWQAMLMQFPSQWSPCLHTGSSPIGIYSIVPAGLSGTIIGSAYVFVTLERRLYITLQFECSYMFNTQPNFASQRVAVGVWTDANTQWQSYVDVLYSTGFYTCYTLSIDLFNVCDASEQVRHALHGGSTDPPPLTDSMPDICVQAMFTASPNDPTLTACSCPGDPTCSTLNFSNEVTTLQQRSALGPSCMLSQPLPTTLAHSPQPLPMVTACCRMSCSSPWRLIWLPFRTVWMCTATPPARAQCQASRCWTLCMGQVGAAAECQGTLVLYAQCHGVVALCAALVLRRHRELHHA
jgi:hypothetical protein